MNIKEALDKLLSEEYKCISRKDESGEKVRLYEVTQLSRIHLEVRDLVATNWRTLKGIPK